MEVGLPWTSVVDMLPMARFVGSMLNGTDVRYMLFYTFFPITGHSFHATWFRKLSVVIFNHNSLEK